MKIAQDTKVSIVFTVQKCKSNIVVEFGDRLYDNVKKIWANLFAVITHCGNKDMRDFLLLRKHYNKLMQNGKQ